jgi:hypothetical protein
MAQTSGDAEIRALQDVIAALEPLDAEARNRVLDYTLKRLGMREVSVLAAAPILTAPAQETEAPSPRGRSGEPSDIRSLREAKQPGSIVEMAALVAYYLAEIAPEDERKDAIVAADLEKYLKQANYRLPSRIDTTLSHAASAGYLDRAARGEYKLNPVGFNLVTQTLPRSVKQGNRRSTARKKPSAKSKAKPESS